MQDITQKLALFHIEKLKLFNSAKVCEVGLFMAKKEYSSQLYQYKIDETSWEIFWGLPENDWFYYRNEMVSLV